MAPKRGMGVPPPLPPSVPAGRLLSRQQSLSSRTKKQFGGSAGGKEGLAAFLRELTKRSPFFQQIEEDAKNHAKTILELKAAINSFRTKDMTELIKFQQYMEAILEVLTDENQVLAKFEDFPIKKLETIRAAAALYSKSNLVVSNLKNWEVKSPAAQLLNKFDCYFTKVKEELDAFERTKDEESRNFKSHGIDFDFNIFVTIKELMVDVSSNCMELVLKEWGETKGANDAEKKANKNLLWRTFKLAFRVYSFAGGNDERADKLAKELANEVLCGSS
ncbi:hypothetical protein Gogos_011300 [Gossypium gossypioides]|uniref:Uncharacterized protein n=1 Tax=Gossypium gossypioides TaxID=34282 RepID=A0A7J9BNU6_GOSGO|nr:hypothetical protein [Gossypium gossypioides]